MVITVSNQKELADLAQLLLRRYTDFYSNNSALTPDCGCAGTLNTTTEVIEVDKLYIARILFIVGTTGAPAVGDTSFGIKNANGDVFNEVLIDFYRAGILQTQGVNYDFDETTIVDNLVSPFTASEEVEIKVFKKKVIEVGHVVPITSTILGLPYSLPFILTA
jgi:hypothetical protein